MITSFLLNLKTNDVLAFMRTCHLVYSTSLPHLFEGVVFLQGVNAIRSFRHLMVSLSKSGRTSLLRALDVRSDTMMALHPGFRIEARHGLETMPPICDVSIRTAHFFASLSP